MRAADPDNRQALFDVAAIGSGYGAYLGLMGDTAAALAPLGKAVDAAERLNRLSGPGSGNQDLLQQVHQRFAAGLTAVGRFDEAFEHLAKAEEYVADAEKKNPGLARNASGLADILDSRASVYVAQKRWAEAVPVYRQLIAIFEPLFQRDPNDVGFLSERPRQYANLADCYAALLQWDRAISAIDLALERFHELELRRPLQTPEQAERDSAVAKRAQWLSM
jgi:tetratricopeptide (TPR) repeat protein